MKSSEPCKVTRIFYISNPGMIILIFLIINFLLRLFIYFKTRIFYFSDYSAYLNGIENIARGEPQYLLSGNFLFAISYIGYFAKYVMGNIDYFFIFNCLIATLTSLVLYWLIVKVTGSPKAGIFVIIIHTLYTEFMVFSSVFYTPIIMIFLLSLIILLIWYFVTTKKIRILIFSGTGIIILYLLTFFFKPELQYLPYFLIALSLILIHKGGKFIYKISVLSVVLIIAFLVLDKTEAISHQPGNIISNEFIFFGHTEYGGDGGEGSFVYPQNETRFNTALEKYCSEMGISEPDATERNNFRMQEIKKFITKYPFKWIELQLTKFFRTFGVVPESTSFKIIYTGLFKNNLWLTSIIVVTPVALIILLFILFINFPVIKMFFNSSTTRSNSDISGFLYIYLTLFIYYLIATIFFGHYQERYRLPVMVIFVIPMLAYFISTFNRERFFNKVSLVTKSVLIVLFLTIWIIQTKKAISNKERFENAIEDAEMRVEMR